MRYYFRFLWIGLLLGLFTEAQLKLVAGINPRAFGIAVFVYPLIISFFYAISRFFDRRNFSTWKGDVLHYFTAGVVGLLFEWTLLGNGPGSNAFQLGMFAMWTTFGFGPRILTRDLSQIRKSSRRFWITFGIVAIPLTLAILLASTPGAKVVVAVIGLSATYIIWSLWLLMMSWRNRG